MSITSICHAIIIVLIIILFHAFYQQYLIDSNQETTIMWEIDKPYEIYVKLKDKFGEPTSIEINNIHGVCWNLEKHVFKKITLLDQEKNLLIVSFPMKLFSGYDHIQITQRAVYHKLSQMTGLCKNINYNTSSKNITIKCDSWEGALALSYLLTKISTSELTLKEIRENEFIKKYEKRALADEDKYYREFEKYYLENK